MLWPHQVMVDVHELRGLHQLTGAMMGGTVPSSRKAAVESVPYTLPEVSRDEKKCPVCHQVFQTSHRMLHHMDIHKGTSYPCSRCHKSLALRKTLWQHKKAYKEDLRHVCGECQKSYASAQILKQHVKVTHCSGCPGRMKSFFVHFVKGSTG